MSHGNTPLHDAFLQDHRQLTRGLADIRRALRRGEDHVASQKADEIDRQVGPHMQFEETVFYPFLRGTLGDAYVDRLYQEHEVARGAIRALVSHAAVGLSEAERQDLGERIELALQHAQSCGTLLSHLDRLSDAEREELTEKIETCRRDGRRWTDN